MSSFEVLFDLPQKQRRIGEITFLSQSPDFWKDNKKAKELTQEKSRLEGEVGQFEELERNNQDAETLFQLALEETDKKILKEVSELIHTLSKQLATVEFRKLLSEKDDPKNAILTINAGAGGTESQDWAEMLLRMYQRWSEAQGFQFKLIDRLAGEEAGIKSATASIVGSYAYGRLKSEAGVHRLVRISPFDANKRRHTSFSSVFVSPEVDEEVEITINPVEIRIDVFRSGGKGGQGVNTTDSAVRITHIPTGIVVTCQQERSQIKNREIAMKIMRSRLYERHLEAERKRLAAVEETKKDIAWGHQIRSYVLHPYKMVKDHRTGFSTSSAEDTLNGELEEFIKAYLTCRVTGQWVRSGSQEEDY